MVCTYVCHLFVVSVCSVGHPCLNQFLVLEASTVLLAYYMFSFGYLLAGSVMCQSIHVLTSTSLPEKLLSDFCRASRPFLTG